MKLSTALKLNFGDRVKVKKSSRSKLAGKVVYIFDANVYGCPTNHDGVSYNSDNMVDVSLTKDVDWDNGVGSSWGSVTIEDLELIKEKK